MAAAIRTLNNGKAQGVDRIPNEAIKNGPVELTEKITKLFQQDKGGGDSSFLMEDRANNFGEEAWGSF